MEPGSSVVIVTLYMLGYRKIGVAFPVGTEIFLFAVPRSRLLSDGYVRLKPMGKRVHMLLQVEERDSK